MNPYAKNAQSAQDVYKTRSVQTASQAGLITMLFDGAARFMREFIEAVNTRRIEVAHEKSMKAQRIMTELIISLDHSKGGPVAKVIEAAYDDIRNRMALANIRKDIEAARKVITDLESFKETWSAVFRQVEGEFAPPARSGVSIQT